MVSGSKRNPGSPVGADKRRPALPVGDGATQPAAPKSQAAGAPLFIHFGTRKTGRSSIQETLYGNSGAQFGYDYPRFGMANGSLTHNLAFLADAQLVARRLAATLEQAQTRKATLRGRLTEFLTSPSGGVPKVLSAESIASFREAELADLDQFTGAHCADRVYLGYVREPVSYLRSTYLETLKQDLPNWQVIDPDAPIGALRANAHEIVNHLDALVGRDRVRAFAFDPDGFPDGDVVRHFLRQIGVRDDGIQILRKNDSLTLLATKLLYLYRSRKAGHDRDIGHNKSRNAFINSFKDLGGARFELHADVTARIIAANRAVYDWSAERLDRPLRPPAAGTGPAPGTDGGVGSPADLEQLTPGDVADFDGLLRGYGLTLPAQPDAEAIAEAMHSLRLHFTAQAKDSSASRVKDAVQSRLTRLIASPNSVVQPKPTADAAPPLVAVPPPTAVPPAAVPAPAVPPPAVPPPAVRPPIAAVRSAKKAVLAAAKPQLVLHIGMGKTGTTALQNFFWANRDKLAELGVLYPDLGVLAGAHHRISPHMPKFLADQGWSTLPPESWIPNVAGRGFDRVLMSSELIAWSTPEKIAAFAAALEPAFDTSICLYLRRQDNMMMASYNQQIKAGTQIRPLGKVVAPQLKQFDYAERIGAWEQVFGSARMIVRPYERAQFPDGDLIADFMTHVLGINDLSGFVRPNDENSNPRFSRVALEFKRLINAIEEDTARTGRFNPALIAFSGAQDAGSTEIFQDQDLLSSVERQKILDHFADRNADIARRFLNRADGVLFTEPVGLAAAAAPEVTEAELLAPMRWLAGQEPALLDDLEKMALANQDESYAVTRKAARQLLRLMGKIERPLPKSVAPATKPAAKPAAKRVTKPVATLAPTLAATPTATPAVARATADRRIVVHPGLPKTGTTAIQQSFHKNHAALLAQGILYPALDENHTKPILAMFHARLDQNVRFGAMSEADRATYAVWAREALEAELANLDWHTLILSGEGISNLTAEEWQQIHAWLSAYAARIEVVFSLRAPLELTRSAVQQNLKTGRLIEDQYAKPPTLNPRTRLEAVMTVLPIEAIQLWDFDAAVQSPGGMVRHFAKAIGLDDTVAALLAATRTFANPSLSQPAVEMLASRNRLLDRRKPITGPELAKLTAVAGPKFQLPDEVIARVNALIAPDLAWLKATFGYEGVRFDPALQPPEPDSPPRAARMQRPEPPKQKPQRSFATRVLGRLKRMAGF